MSLSIRCQKCGTAQTVASAASGTVACAKCGHAISLAPFADPTQVVADEVTEVVDDVALVDVAEALDADSFGDLPDFDANPAQPIAATDNSDFDAFLFEGESNTAVPDKPAPAAPVSAAAMPIHQKPAAKQADIKPAPQKKPQADSQFPILPIAIAATATLLLLLMGGLVWWLMSGPDSTASSNNGGTSAATTGGASDSDSGGLAGGIVDPDDTPWAVAEANRDALRQRPSDSVVSVSSTPSTTSRQPNRTSSNTGNSSPTKAVAETPAKPLSREEVIEQIKSATVFIQVDTGNGVQTGSGFLMSEVNGTGVVVTNAHVVTPEQGSLRNLNCVFHSGTTREFTVRASLTAKDEYSDLAFLSVRHKDLPSVVSNSTKEPKITLTSTVLAAGFPFGESLKTSKRNPSITITKGSVSSIRLGDHDEVALLQIDGGINPGNSGGPVLTEDGQLIGIAVAKVRGTNIGFAIPKRVLTNTLGGRVTKVSVTKTKSSNGKIYHSFVFEFVDPMRTLKEIEVIGFKTSEQAVTKPDAHGRWDAASKSPLKKLTIRVSGSKSSASIDFPEDAKDISFQIKIVQRDGTHRWMEPSKIPNTLKTGDSSVASNSAGSANALSEVLREMDGSRIVVLPHVMSDFAMNPMTGDIACTDPNGNRAFMVSVKKLESDKPSSLPETRVGTTPVSITFKQYEDTNYFAVVCSQDSHLYVLDANSLELVKKVPVAGAGLSHVTASINPKDPFVYYNYGSGHDSETGAIDLRRMVDCGKAFDDAMDCAISADGRIAYRRGPWSPSGFESLTMTGDFSDPKPTFTRLFYDHHSTGAYVPDPFGQFTASGSSVYTFSLEKEIAKVDFAPACFFKSRPILVGLSGNMRDTRSKKRLRAASYNTFAASGSVIDVPAELVGQSTALPRGVQSRADFKRVGLKTRILADDINKRVVYAANDKIALIPLDAFGIPDEPFMNLTSNSSDLRVGAEQKIAVRSTDPKVKIEFGDMPEGMTQVSDGLSWKPADEHVGTTSVPVTLSFNDIQRVIDYQITVRQPSIKVPIDVTDFIIGPNSSYAVCWSGPGFDKFGRMNRTSNNAQGKGSEVCIMPFRRGAQPIRKQLPFLVKEAALLGSRIAILPASDNQQVHVYELKTMERVKLLLATSPLVGLEVSNGQLSLKGTQSVDVYSAQTLKRLRSVDAANSSSNSRTSRTQQPELLLDGMLQNGILRSGSTPILVLAPGRIPALRGAQSNLMQGSFLRRATPPANPSNLRSSTQSQSAIVAGPLKLPKANLQVSLENRTNVVSPAGSVHTRRTQRTVTLLVIDDDGALVSRVPMVKEVLGTNVASKRPTMKIADGNVMVASGSRLYRWTPPRAQPKGPDADTPSGPVDLHFVPKQSAFVASGRSTTLKHAVAGGSPPYDYFLMTRLSGVDLDDETGDVTVSREQLMESVLPVLTSVARGAKTPAEIGQQLKARSLDLMADFHRMTGRKPKGYPIAVPIYLKASDSAGKVAEMQYFIFLDISVQEAANKIQIR